MKVLDRIAARRAAKSRARKAFTQPAFWSVPDPWLTLAAPWSTPDREKIGNDFEAYIQGAYKSNGIVFACMLARQLVFSEARPQWQELVGGRPGDLFDSAELSILKTPEPNRTTGELLSLMETDSVLAGNYYSTTVDDAGRFGAAATGKGRRIARMRPDWVTLIISSATNDPYALDAHVVGILYEPPLGAIGGGKSAPVLLLPDEVCHYSPIPDPDARFRGMSPLTPILKEISADKAATAHKERFFANGAILNTVVKFDRDTSPEAFDAFVERFKASHEGEENAFKTLFLGGGADVTVVGTNLNELDFKNVQGGGETRVAAALRVHPVIVGLSEGLAGSSLNAGNFSAAKKGFVDGTLRPLWRMAFGSLANLVTVPANARLWYDDRDIAYLREDAKDAAEIVNQQMTTIRVGVDSGFEPDAMVDAVTAGDLKRLKGHHTGMTSVQLLPPGTTAPRPTPDKAPPDKAPPKALPRSRFDLKGFDPSQLRGPDGRWVDSMIFRKVFKVGGHDVAVSAHADGTRSIEFGGRSVNLTSGELSGDRRSLRSLAFDAIDWQVGEGDALTRLHDVRDESGRPVGARSDFLLGVKKTAEPPDVPDGEENWDLTPLSLHLPPNEDPSYDELLNSPGIEMKQKDLALLAEQAADMIAERVDTGGGGHVDMFRDGGRFVLRPQGGDEVSLDRKSVRALNETLNDLIDDSRGPSESVERTVPTNAGDVTVRMTGEHPTGEIRVTLPGGAEILLPPGRQDDFLLALSAMAGPGGGKSRRDRSAVKRSEPDRKPEPEEATDGP